jgi:TonB-dependent starch-binding outer membrane protein SusC
VRLALCPFGGSWVASVSNRAVLFVFRSARGVSHPVVVRRLGYGRRTQSVTVPAGGDVRVDFTVSQAATQLEAVVTTGTAGAQERRTIGNAVTQLDASEVTQRATVTNVSDVLQGRATGVTVATQAGTPGAATEITIRGYGSFTTNRPVVYIDGIRMDTDNLGNFGPSGAGTTQFSGQTTSALDLINPQDIESMEVLKGPAAATLYGADAAGGVINIITKKGRRGQQPLRWTGRFETGRNEWGVDHIVNYTTCTAARKAEMSGGNPVWPGCQDVADNAVITDTPMARDPLALRNGDVQNVSLSLRGGGDRYSYYVSAEGIHNEGVHFNSHDDRRSLRTNFTVNPTNALDFNINVGYIRSRLRLPLGDEAGNGLLLSAARGIPGRIASRPSLVGWATLEPALANRYNNQTVTDRLIVGTTANYNPFRWWRNRATAGLDFRSGTAQILSLPGDPDVPAGLNAMRAPKAHIYTLDGSSSFVFDLPRDVQSTSSVGTQITSRREERIDATGSQLPTREVTIIGAALSVSGANFFNEFNQVGVYAQQQFGWKNRLFVTGALRADDHSSFGSDFDFISYPKASVSYVASEEPALQPFLQAVRAGEVRLRGAWGRAGRAPAPYSATQTYGSVRVATGPTAVGGGLQATAFGNPDLKPETGDEIELGFDADFLSNRAGIEFTYYRKTMSDLLVPLALPPSLGFPGSMLQNLGKTRNNGVELGVTATPVNLPRFVWDSRLNYTWNKNELLLLDTLRTEEVPGGASYSPGMQRNRVGFPLGSYFVRHPQRDAQGNFVFTTTSTGALVPVYEQEFEFLGPAVPTRLISFSNTLTFFRHWQLYALLDHQGGHYLFNYKEYNRCALAANGPNCERLNRPGISAEEFALYRTVGTPTVVTSPMTQTLYVEKADFVKLRDVSLTYTVPASYARRLRMESASIVLSGRNLSTWTDYTGLDPEVNGYSNNVARGSGNNSQFVRVDAYPAPQIRRYTLTLSDR